MIEVTGPLCRTIAFQNSDVTIAGTLDLLAGEGLFTAIVVIHGSSPLSRNDINNLYASHFFIQHSYAVLLYDIRGAGESTGVYPDIGDGEEDG